MYNNHNRNQKDYYTKYGAIRSLSLLLNLRKSLKAMTNYLLIDTYQENCSGSSRQASVQNGR